MVGMYLCSNIHIHTHTHTHTLSLYNCDFNYSKIIPDGPTLAGLTMIFVFLPMIVSGMLEIFSMLCGEKMGISNKFYDVTKVTH